MSEPFVAQKSPFSAEGTVRFVRGLAAPRCDGAHNTL